MCEAENRIDPVDERSSTSSLTERTAENPTPNRPVTPSSASTLFDARSAVSACTPDSSSGRPVFATVSVRPSTSTHKEPWTPSRAAASAAFCASSVSRRSRYPAFARSDSAAASSRNRVGDSDHARSVASRSASVPNGSSTRWIPNPQLQQRSTGERAPQSARRPRRRMRRTAASPHRAAGWCPSARHNRRTR